MQESSAPSPTVATRKLENPPLTPVPPTKEKTGFFRRVFGGGSSKISGTTCQLTTRAVCTCCLPATGLPKTSLDPVPHRTKLQPKPRFPPKPPQTSAGPTKPSRSSPLKQSSRRKVIIIFSAAGRNQCQKIAKPPITTLWILHLLPGRSYQHKLAPASVACTRLWIHTWARQVLRWKGSTRHGSNSSPKAQPMLRPISGILPRLQAPQGRHSAHGSNQTRAETTEHHPSSRDESRRESCIRPIRTILKFKLKGEAWQIRARSPASRSTHCRQYQP